MPFPHIVPDNHGFRNSPFTTPIIRSVAPKDESTEEQPTEEVDETASSDVQLTDVGAQQEETDTSVEEEETDTSVEEEETEVPHDEEEPKPKAPVKTRRKSKTSN